MAARAMCRWYRAGIRCARTPPVHRSRIYGRSRCRWQCSRACCCWGSSRCRHCRWDADRYIRRRCRCANRVAAPARSPGAWASRGSLRRYRPARVRAPDPVMQMRVRRRRARAQSCRQRACLERVRSPMQRAALPELQVRSVAEPQSCPPQPEDWLGQSAAAQLYQAPMVMAWMRLPFRETVRRQRVALAGVAGALCAAQRKRPPAVVPVRPVAVAYSYPERLQMAARWRSLAPPGDGAGCIALSGVAGVICDDGAVTAAGADCCGATTVTPRGVDPAGAVAAGSGDAGLSVSSWGVTGCAG